MADIDQTQIWETYQTADRADAVRPGRLPRLGALPRVARVDRSAATHSLAAVGAVSLVSTDVVV